MTTALEKSIDKLDQVAHRMGAEEKAELALSTAKTRLILGRDGNSCFFASCVTRLKFSPDWNIPTAGTDGRRLVYNPDFVNSLTHPELIGVLAHEAMHCVNKHFSRMGHRNVETWNVACDLAVNLLIKDAGMTLPKDGAFPGTKPFEDMPPGLSAEEYYALLPKADGGQGEGQGDGPGAPGSDPGGCGGVMLPEEADQADLQQLDREWSANVASALQTAERRGNLSAGLKRLVGEVLAPAVDWKASLREFITRPAKNEITWKRANRRYVANGMYLPSLRGMEIGHVVVLVDCSGSVDHKMLTRFGSELTDISSQGVEKMTIVYHDSKVCHVDVWEPIFGDVVLDNHGGGGTAHEPCFDWIAENCDESPAVCVALTDLYSSFPKHAPDYPVLWAATSDQPAPWGERLRIPAE